LSEHATTGPPLPEGRHVVLPGRGRTWIREIPGRPGAPTVLLLHGWTASADLNWFSSFRALADAGFHVVAIDHRGHGRGIRSWRPFRMRDAADDAAALLDALGVDRAIAVGYSMGGAVAQLLWRRHGARVHGLVLCATSSVFAETDRERRWFAAMGAMALAARVTPAVARRAVASWLLDRRQDSAAVEWVQRELQRNDWSQVLAAGGALGRFDSRPWLGEVDVPACVVLTRFDRVVPPRRQAAMARAIPGAVIHEVDGDHGVCAMQPGRFVPALLRALRDVAARSGDASAPVSAR
jgi:3-oxoadipate enol-lactonase